MERQPLLIVMCGPHGAGKSTGAELLVIGELAIINVDLPLADFWWIHDNTMADGAWLVAEQPLDESSIIHDFRAWSLIREEASHA